MQIKEIVAIAVVMLALDAVYLGSNRSFFFNLFRNVQGSELKFNFKAVSLLYINGIWFILFI